MDNFHARWSTLICNCSFKAAVYNREQFAGQSQLKTSLMIKQMQKHARRGGCKVLSKLPEHCPKCGAVIVEEVKTMDAEGNIDG